jgi:long-chain-alcohol oxidase
MGSNPATSVVCETGESWDVAGLYVADASLFPTASGVNPMITIESLCHMVAEGAAQTLTGTAIAKPYPVEIRNELEW